MEFIKKQGAAAIVLCLAVLVGSGCSKTVKTTGMATNDQREADLNVVATTTMISDLVNIIGAGQVNVTALMGPGIDPHLYQASAGDVINMQEADIVVYNGIHLEGKMGDIFASLKEQGRTVICLEDGLDEIMLLADAENPQIHDPHIWFDVLNWKAAAKHLAAELSKADPEHRECYQANLDAYLIELDELDQYIKNRILELPQTQRVLVTAHDAFRYFGRAYGVHVMGLQGISTDAEAGTADLSNLAAFIANNQIKAIFVESSVPPKNIEALQAAVKAKGFQVIIGGELYSDSLGDQESGTDTYLLTVKANVDTIVDALK